MITSLILEWFDWSCHCVDDISRTQLTIYRNTRRVDYKEFDGRDNVLLAQSGTFSKSNGECFFSFLEKINADVTKRTDYSVEVCDGSCWELKIRHSGNKLQKLKGTVEYPPHGKRMEQELLRLCEEANVFEPYMFGCSGVPLQGANEFANKWLDLLQRMPNDVYGVFESFMGEDCLALGFEMDCGKGFEAEYSNSRLLYDADALASIINTVDDVELLGSAIISKWRYLTHWSQEDYFSSSNKAWFLIALTRLKELTRICDEF